MRPRRGAARRPARRAAAGVGIVELVQRPGTIEPKTSAQIGSIRNQAGRQAAQPVHPGAVSSDAMPEVPKGSRKTMAIQTRIQPRQTIHLGQKATPRKRTRHAWRQRDKLHSRKQDDEG